MRNTKFINSLLAKDLIQLYESILQSNEEKEMDENLWVTHNSLTGTLRVKRKNIVRNIELFLLLNFVVCIQNLCRTSYKHKRCMGKLYGNAYDGQLRIIQCGTRNDLRTA